MPIQVIWGSKAGGAPGTNSTAGWSKLHPLLSLPSKKQTAEVAAHATLPEAVLTLPRRRELMLVNAHRAEGGDPSPSPRGWQEAHSHVETNSSGRAEGGDAAQRTAGTAGTRTALGW